MPAKVLRGITSLRGHNLINGLTHTQQCSGFGQIKDCFLLKRVPLPHPPPHPPYLPTPCRPWTIGSWKLPGLFAVLWTRPNPQSTRVHHPNSLETAGSRWFHVSFVLHNVQNKPSVSSHPLVVEGSRPTFETKVPPPWVGRKGIVDSNGRIIRNLFVTMRLLLLLFLSLMKEDTSIARSRFPLGASKSSSARS